MDTLEELTTRLKDQDSGYGKIASTEYGDRTFAQISDELLAAVDPAEKSLSVMATPENVMAVWQPTSKPEAASA